MSIEKKKSPSGGNRDGAMKSHSPQFTSIILAEQDVIAGFMQALDQAGLFTKDAIIADGQLHRFHVEGDKTGSKNGFYVLYGDGVPAGCFGSWKTGDTVKWCVRPDKELTQAQRKQNRIRMIEAQQKARKIEEEKRRKSAQEKAQLIWDSVPQAPDAHPYLVKKGVKNHGLGFYKGLLVVPMRDNIGNLHSLQFIDCDGNKRFLSGGLKKGCYFSIGSPADTLCVAEGYATAATLYQTTNLPIVVAFDAGNLMPVVQALRARFPYIEIIICADNDEHTPGNPGLTKAREAAVSVGALLALPPCVGDFNDFFTGAAE